MRFTRARSVVILGGLVLSGCGTVLPAPGESAPERSTEGTEPEATETPPNAPATTDLVTSTVPIDSDAGGGDAGPKKANGADCSANAECESGVCLLEGKAHYCTIACDEPDEKDEVCEALGAPFGGDCNKQGFCKR